MDILFLSQWLPYPTNNGSKLRIYNLLCGLAHRHRVTLLSFADECELNSVPAELSAICREVQILPRQKFDPHSSRSRLGFFSQTPRSLYATYSQEMERRIKQSMSSTSYDLVIASQLAMASYMPFLPKLPALFEEAELGLYYDQFMNASSSRARLRYALTWAKQSHYLNFLLRHFSACTVVSERERALLLSCVSEKHMVEVVPNFVNLCAYKRVQPSPEPNTLIFTGSLGYFANHDAMVWFLQEIFPRIRASVPESQLIITGDHGDLPLPPAENVIRKGLVGDVASLIASAGVSLVPIRQGGGTRLKILEAMALRTPVVATTKGVEGLEVQHGKHLLIADTPEDFARQTIRLLNEPELRRCLKEHAYRLVAERYDSSIVMPRLMNLLTQIVPSV